MQEFVIYKLLDIESAIRQIRILLNIERSALGLLVKKSLEPVI